MASSETEAYFARRETESIELKEVEFGGFGFKGKWVADRKQQSAAWELYIELATRVALRPLDPHHGLLREALSSLYSLFGETRRVLKEYGPDVAILLGRSSHSFAEIAVRVLNDHLHPLLAYWHPRLQVYEQGRPPSVSPLDHERAWSDQGRLRAALDELRPRLSAYACLLARASGVEPFHPRGTSGKVARK